jgi:flagellar hook-length control protein FliK
MMQNVATAKSEVAAFATDTGSNSFADTEPNEQFGKLLQQSTDETSKESSSSVREGTTTQTKSTSNEYTETHVEANDHSVNESAANNLNDELNTANTKAESQLAVPSKQNDVESESDVESASIVAQEWVSLVDNLQKLADMDLLTKQPLVDAKGQSIDVPLADLTLSSKVGKGLLEQITDRQMDGKRNTPINDVGLLQVEDIKVAQSLSMLVNKSLD